MSKNQAQICEECKEAKKLLTIRYGETTEICPKCNKETKIYYRHEGRFIINHCQSCHSFFNEDYPTCHSAYSGGLNG